MLAAALLGMLAANSALAPQYHAFTHQKITILSLIMPLHAWVNDVAMVLFFFLVGLELKAEITEGILADKKQILLPFFAALGGMIIPALIYAAANHGIVAHQPGWAIPTATDIAFAMAVLVVLGDKVPSALKILLLAIAVFDDIGAISIIAIYYSEHILLLPLVIAGGALCLLAVLNRFHRVHRWPYIAAGMLLCISLHNAGIHATIGGVITALLMPIRDREGQASPVKRTMHMLHPWVNTLLLPVFAFVTAGVLLERAGLMSLATSPLSLGIIGGLFVGKQLGILGAIWLTVKLKLAALPAQITWQQMHAISVIAGIGFTMSLFIGGLAFKNETLLMEAKLAVIAGSMLSAVVGYALLKRSLKKGAT